MLLQHLHRIRRQPQAVGADAGEWLGMEVKGGPVFFADFELDADEQNRRATRLAKGPDASSSATISSRPKLGKQFT
jgi:hypothetical protein